MRLLREAMLYKCDFPLQGRSFYLNLTLRKGVGVLGGTICCMISDYSLNNSEFFITESNKQESSTESLYAPYSYIFVSQPRAKIFKSTVSFFQAMIIAFLYLFIRLSILGESKWVSE